MNAKVTFASQTHRLREELERSKIAHGATARVDIPRVRVGAGVAAEPHIFFCDVRDVRVRREVVAGDGEPLPPTVVVDGLDFPSEGIYDLRNAVVSANGDIRIDADEETELHRVDVPVLTVVG